MTVDQQARVGEVIEASTTSFTAAAYEFLAAPPFGALVRASTSVPTLQVYGLVYDICTSSREPGGRAAVRGGPRYDGQEFYDEQIYREHPDLQEVLQTEFSALVVGFARHGEIRHYLPPQPATVHYSVYECEADELLRFSESCDFFRAVLLAAHLPADDLLATTVRRAASARGSGQRSYLVGAGRALAGLLKEDYDRLRALLRRISA